MLPQPSDSYRGRFPPQDPHLPVISQAHESAEEAWNKASGTKNMQQQAMMRHALRHAPLQQIHSARLGLSDGDMQDRAPMTLTSEYHTTSEHQSAADEEEGAWWDTPDYYSRSSPFRNANQTGLVQHLETQTEHTGSIRREAEEGGDGGDEGGEAGGGGEAIPPPPAPPRTNWVGRGWNHMKVPALMTGRTLASFLVATSHYGGGVASSAIGNTAIGFGEVLSNWAQDGEEQPPPPPLPPALPPPRPVEVVSEQPAQPVPPFLLDRDERMAAARPSHHLGRFASGEADRLRRQQNGQPRFVAATRGI